MILNYNGKDLTEFGVYSFGTDAFNTPERDISTLEIQGRNGTLTIDNGRFKNITVIYPSAIKENFIVNSAYLRDFLAAHMHGYYRLYDDVNTDTFRLARVLPVSFKTFPRIYGADFNLTFDCKPQRFLFSGEREIVLTEDDYALNNPTSMVARPLFICYGNGILDVGGKNFTISGNTTGRAFVDCESMNVYNGATNLNSKFTGEFLELGAENNISYEGFTRVICIPRWWTL